MSIILSKNECRRYSISRAIAAATVRGSLEKTGLEIDASRATRDQFLDLNFGSADGCIIPPEILLGTEQERNLTVANFSGLRTRAGLAVGNFAGGGALVGGEERDPIFFRFLFPQSIVFGLGANFLGGLSAPDGTGTGAFAIPVITGAAEGQWLGEFEAANTSQNLAAALRVATPRRVTSTQIVSNQLLRQTSPQAEAALWKILMAAVAAAIDRAALCGTGGVQPLGILNMLGVTEVSLGTNGAAPTLAKLNALEAGPLNSNVPLGAGGYALSVNTRATLKALQKAAGTSTFLLETKSGQDFVNGSRAFPTKLMSDTLTKGTGASLGSLIFGADWSTLLVCHWAGLMIVADPYTYAASGKTLLTITCFLDVVSSAPAAFARCVDVVNTATSLLPVGPTFSTQANSTGDSTVAPLSQIHTEQITFTGSAGTRNVVIDTSGLVAGDRLDILALFPGGADNGIRVKIYAVSTGGTLLFDWTRSGSEANALFSSVAGTSGVLTPLAQVIPAFP